VGEKAESAGAPALTGKIFLTPSGSKTCSVLSTPFLFSFCFSESAAVSARGKQTELRVRTEEALVRVQQQRRETQTESGKQRKVGRTDGRTNIGWRSVRE
jgi:hypothetical protein